ncbi:cytosolic phospholipase A2 gamma [Pogona vitticeps]
MSSLYKNEDWSEKMETLEKLQREKLVKGKWDFIKAKKTLLVAARDDHYSLTDFWAYFIVYKMLKELDESKLSDQRKSCENGKNPYPIYAAVDKHTYSRHEAGSWFEFTPHNTGVPGIDGSHSTGAYVDMQELGSVFREGQLNEKRTEKTICYLQGLWGSALASEKEIKKAIIEALLDFLKQDRDAYFPSSSKDSERKAYKHIALLPRNKYETPSMWVKHGPSASPPSMYQYNEAQPSFLFRYKRQNSLEDDDQRCRESHDFSFSILYILDWIRHIHKTNSCILTWTWGTTSNFVYNMPDVKVPNLKRKEVVSLIDAGLAINSGYPLVLDPERNVKLILSFDYSAGDPFETVKKAAEYCKVRGIKFPVINESELQDKDNPSNCYVFRGDNITVMHFPLFNKVNCQDKIAEYRDTFSTFKLKYTDEEIGKLLIAAKKNVADVQQKILEEIKRIVGSSSEKA